MTMAETADSDGASRSRPARVVWGVRSRILLWYVLLMSAAIIASVLVVRRVLKVQVDQQIDDALVQEMDELRRLAQGRDPDTGERFGGNVERIFEVLIRGPRPYAAGSECGPAHRRWRTDRARLRDR